MSGRAAPRVAVVVSVVTLVVALVGFIVTLVLNAFVFDEFDAYGEVPIPGTGSIELPTGRVSVSFRTVTAGQPTSGFPIPAISINIESPEGAADPVVTESIGATTTVNDDTHVRVWVVQVADAGAYRVTTDGDTSGYINPRLAFGHGSSYGWLPRLCGGVAGLGLLLLVAALIWSARTAKAAQQQAPHEVPDADGPRSLHAVPAPASSHSPDDRGVRFEQLKQLAALRDSGALTEAEFQAEKRRLLDG
ncbi:SHOCT domain-containing protein [Mycolicibacterium sp. ND9-15]|uniref:SHOCT domain-containing protein n=1 Tax=Mycolicibacterium sp. ND9-15 TaxID=3042320 RepID=UPI002DDA592F|nr:SHOCT domain-containing protein [Mycolicibacterium sp. ND9-15]WSE55851.1 SHOCT domain-containing protein [Mycolicibacterium sp. ND9-15]